MLSKITVTALFLILSCFHSLNAQSSDSKCDCSLLKENKENNDKVILVGQFIEDSFNEESTDGFNEKFNVEAFGELVFIDEKIDTSDSYTKGFMQGLLGATQNLSDKILSEINNGSYYNFINYEYNIVEKAYYITFRIYSEETGINYHEYKLCTDGEDIMINDMYIYLTGEHLSETLKRIFLATKPNRKSKGKKNNMSLVIESKKLLDAGDYKNAHKKISEIKGELAKEKFILLYKGLISSEFDEELYAQDLLEFAKYYPNDPTLYLKQIDYYFLKEDYKMVLEKIDKLMFETEDDFLNILKASVYLMSEDFENADINYKFMVENYPFLMEAYVGYISSLTYQGKYKDALVIADKLVDQGYDKEVLSDFFEEKDADGTNVLQPLVESKIYKEWKKD